MRPSGSPACWAASRAAHWLPSMSSSTRVAKRSSLPSRPCPAQTTRLHATVRKGRPKASKCAAVGVSAWAAAHSAAALLIRSQRAADTLGVPRLPACGLGLEVLGDIAADVGVGARVAGLRVARRAGVVDVVGGLLPRIENHLPVGVVGVQRGDDALGRVVEQHRADADADIELEAVGVGEEGLELADRLALVVEHRPAAADPARGPSRPGLGLDLLLDLAAEAVGAGKAELDLQALRRQRGARMRFADKRGGAGRPPPGRVVRVRLPGAAEAVNVVDDACSRVLQQRRCVGVWIERVEQAIQLGLREVSSEAGQCVTFHRRRQRLAHDRGAHHHAQRIEDDFSPVAVRVADQARLQDAVIVGVDGDSIVECIASLRHEQVVGVEVDDGLLAERTEIATRQKKMRARFCQLVCGRDLFQVIEHPAGRDPPVAVVIEVDVAAGRITLSAQHDGGIGQQRFCGLPWMRTLKRLIEEARRECQLVTLAGEAKRLDFTQRQEPAHIVAPIERSRSFDGTPPLASRGRRFVGDFRRGILMAQTTWICRIGLDEVRSLEPAAPRRSPCSRSARRSSFRKPVDCVARPAM